jgi:hypothetical protein
MIILREWRMLLFFLSLVRNEKKDDNISNIELFQEGWSGI